MRLLVEMQMEQRMGGGMGPKSIYMWSLHVTSISGNSSNPRNHQFTMSRSAGLLEV